MKWFNGTIADAVKVSKERNAIFIVFIEGSDSLSAKLLEFLENQRISEKLESESFVAIKVEGGSEAYMQFASIYQIVPVPSLFFIGQSGNPLEIATGVIESVDELERKVINALTANGSSLSENSVLSAETNQPSTSEVPNVVCNDGVCYLKPKTESSLEEQNHPSTPPPTPVSLVPSGTDQSIPDTKQTQDNSAAQEQLKKRLEEIKIQKDIENRNKEKEKEIQRRKDGKELQTFQETKKEMEYKELKESIKREKKQEQEARQKILNQIANDRKERAQKLNIESEPSSSAGNTRTISILKVPINSDQTKLQFKIPNGETHAATFSNSTAFSEIRKYVKTIVLENSGISNFSLITTYPRKEITFDDDCKTLLDLGLFPSGVILVIVKSGPAAKVIARTGGITNIFSTIFWGIVCPILTVLDYFKKFIFGGGNTTESTKDAGAQKRSSEEEISANDLAKKRNLDRFIGKGSSVAGTSSQSDKVDNALYRRTGSNIHRLADQKDDEDDNATWNGNSTQQQ